MWRSHMTTVIKWYWRILITVLTGCLLATVTLYCIMPPITWWAVNRDWSLGGILPRGCAFVIEVGVQILLFSGIPLITCIITYHLLTFRKYRAGTSYCGQCDHALKDLIEPICPHCGQAI